MDQSTTFIVRTSGVLIIFSLLILGTVYGKGFVFPLYFAFLLAILLRRLVNFFETRLRLPSVPAILLAEVIAVGLFLLIAYGILYQIGRFVSDWDAIQKNLMAHVNNVQQWITSQFSVSMAEQAEYVQKAANNTISNSGQVITSTLVSITDVLFNLFLIPIMLFLLLFYHKRLVNFLRQAFGTMHTQSVNSVVSSIKVVIQSYLAGLLIEMVVVAALNIGGLILLGVQYAFLLGLIAAVLNLIPYLGSIIAGSLGVIVTLSTSDSIGKAFGVIAIMVVVQFIDNNILMPRIVGSKVKINALVSILGVILGGVIGGVAGMFLSIPTIAIMKVIFDAVPGLNPWSTLLGDDDNEPRDTSNEVFRYIRSFSSKVPRSGPPPAS